MVTTIWSSIYIPGVKMVSKIKILNEFENSSTYAEFNEILKDYLTIISQGEKTVIDGEEYVGITEREEDYKNILDIIPNLLEQKTNINSILKNKKCILDVFAIREAKNGLCQFKDDPKLYEKFLENLNHYFNFSVSDYTFLVPTNLLIDTDSFFNDLNKILKVFKLEILNPQILTSIVQLPPKKSYDDKTDDSFAPDPDDIKNALKLMEKFPLVLKIDIRAQMRGYAHKEGINRVKSFLGYIAHVDKYQTTSEYFGVFDEYNIINLNYGPFIIIKDKMINWPIFGLEDKIQTRLKLSNQVISEEKFNIMLDVCEKYLQQIKKETLKNLLFKSFSVYYDACSDKTMEYSFLKFWNITENLIKSNRPVPDPELLEIMKQFLNGYLSMRVDFIYGKRNDLVHNGYTENITDSDRNLSKLMADLFIHDAVINMKDLKNRKEYAQHILN